MTVDVSNIHSALADDKTVVLKLSYVRFRRRSFGSGLRRLSDRRVLLLLMFHAPILKPNLNLPLRQAKRHRHFDPSRTTQVARVVEFLFQLRELDTGVRGAVALLVAGLAGHLCGCKSPVRR